ncbi:MAG: stage III sporulation protein SpoIIIAB [Bacillota bacterium]
MLKTLGAGMVILAGSLAGFRVGELYARRPRELKALVGALQLLQTQIGYAATPLREALLAVAEQASSRVMPFFRSAARHLDVQGGYTAAEAWEKAIQDVAAGMALREEDFGVLRDLGAALGSSDREDQVRHIGLALERLKAAAASADEDARRYVRLYNFLGFGAGLGLAILLV